MVVEQFSSRHIGPREHELPKMMQRIGVSSMDQLLYEIFPDSIRHQHELDLPKALTESEYYNHVRKMMLKNKIFHSYIGMGYYNTVTPAVIQRNIFENPSWYTSYTPYQAEISQGRLESLLNFQTMVMELTGMEIANASLLDESTAAAEAMNLMYNTRSKEAVQKEANVLFVDYNVFPQTLAVIQTRATPLGIEVKSGSFDEFEFTDKVFGAIIQYPAGDGKVFDYEDFVEHAHSHKISVAVVADLLSLSILRPPGEWGADIVVGSTQRFGIPIGYGGPHAAYFATKDAFKRFMPGRIIGVSRDVHGNPAMRMSLQTREQHIKRERATSNICTAQALLANMAAMYAVYHGADGLKNIASRVHQMAGCLSKALEQLGYMQRNVNFFDTIKVRMPENIHVKLVELQALKQRLNFRYLDDRTVSIALDETVTLKQLNKILKVFADAIHAPFNPITVVKNKMYVHEKFLRKSGFMNQDVFKRYRSETELMRYIKKLERKDISLTHSMISLGSCTMKLNAAVEMLPLSWPRFNTLHPFAPAKQAKGYHKMFNRLEKYLTEITGFAGTSLQPNSGAAGEYAGLLVIHAYQKSMGQGHRDVVLIPSSAHGTNPASAVLAGYNVVVVECTSEGNVDVTDIERKAQQYADRLAALMITYPSTHGVFETDIMKICKIIHEHGGQVYMDGANMNAQVGLTSPGHIGADVCHLNLHKTFAIPHGGGGPGVGPICVAEHLVPFLPSHPVVKTGGEKGIGAVSAAPWGSASVTVISYGYIRMLSSQGLTESTKMAILNANYLAACLKDYYPILYRGVMGKVAHEMILDCRQFKAMAGITESDIAKRLMDYGFHAPTLSFPVAGTLMVEPTESESLQELDRFVEAMISIRREIDEIAEGKASREDNVLKNAPHTEFHVVSSEWKHSYSREKAAYPLRWIADNKYWPTVGRIDDGYGDRNLVCSCNPIDDYRQQMFTPVNV